MTITHKRPYNQTLKNMEPPAKKRARFSTPLIISYLHTEADRPTFTSGIYWVSYKKAWKALATRGVVRFYGIGYQKSVAEAERMLGAVRNVIRSIGDYKMVLLAQKFTEPVSFDKHLDKYNPKNPGQWQQAVCQQMTQVQMLRQDYDY